MTMDDEDKLAMWPQEPEFDHVSMKTNQDHATGEIVTILRMLPSKTDSVPQAAKRAEGSEDWRPVERELIFGEAIPEDDNPNGAGDGTGFALAMIDKLADMPPRHGVSPGGWMSMHPEELRLELLRHVAKGDPVDVANYAAFLWQRGLSTVSDATRVEIKQVAGPQNREPAEEVRQANEEAAAKGAVPGSATGAPVSEGRVARCSSCGGLPMLVADDGCCYACGLPLLFPLAR